MHYRGRLQPSCLWYCRSDLSVEVVLLPGGPDCLGLTSGDAGGPCIWFLAVCLMAKVALEGHAFGSRQCALGNSLGGAGGPCIWSLAVRQGFCWPFTCSGCPGENTAEAGGEG